MQLCRAEHRLQLEAPEFADVNEVEHVFRDGLRFARFWGVKDC